MSYDAASGLVTCEAGVSLEQHMVAGLPSGCSCRRHLAQAGDVGGAIAADVHGKNHHLAGSFAATSSGSTSTRRTAASGA